MTTHAEARPPLETDDGRSERSLDAVDRDFDAVIAFGGDGTINEAMQPLVGTELAFGGS